ncbi:hypothetical protein [Donghicola eburneus]|uniref:Uncharacterized protein n=1 Tax=Donghicola eburneus TaxID=393278 RepID=A0A1M4N0F8_9RHOB|nr:hypothetical protein [Donghicola eburneus]SCM68342.1 hypothetical protein KARMA_2560 [Donghicola eburneus]SFQ22086.1 hypothetical protein SAMN05421764_102159 [Donghicola eburneus]
MNANQIINIAMRLFGRRLMNKGINAGIDHFSKGKGSKGGPVSGQKNGDIAKKARQISRVMRRF